MKSEHQRNGRVSPRPPSPLAVAAATTTAALLLLCSSAGAAGSSSNFTLSLTPPRGWNSYDSFSWILSEEEFLQNAEYVAANLLKFGYEYVVVDFLWYRKHEPGASVTTSGYEIIDEWGRPVPDPARWPSTRGGKGFKPIADKVHAMGLKFGIHVMRGISTAAVQQITPILCGTDCTKGHNWTARDIAVPGGECSWMWDCFIKVNTSTEGGLAFINSLYQQFAEWGVDLIKHDCVFGVDLAIDEILAVGKAIERTGRPMLYAISPGVDATPDLGKQVAHLSHMYRITSDDWDSWSDVLSHFPVARDFAAAGLIGAPGLWGGKSWPDLDMLPLGWLTDPGATYGAYRPSSLTKDEQLTQITLWAIVKSPLMFGGDLRHVDEWTSKLITQPTVLELNAHSTHNRELSSSSEQSSLPDVTLEDCVTAKSTQWEFKSPENGQDELCWSHPSKPRYVKGRQQAVLMGCLNWRDSPWAFPYLNAESTNEAGRSGQLWSPYSGAGCLELNDFSRDVRFSRCNGRASQVWKLTSQGRLVSEEDGRCAVVKRSSEGWKVWAAQGSKGQSYVAFFNLGSQRANISVAVDDVLNHANSKHLAKAQHFIHQLAAWMDRWRFEFLLRSDKICQQIIGRSHWTQTHLCSRGGGPLMWGKSRWSCTGLDVWNNKQFSSNETQLVASVESHGTVLFELSCTNQRSGQYDLALVCYFLALCVLLIVLLARYYHHFAALRRPWFGYGQLSAKDNSIALEEEGSAGSPLRNQKRMDDFAAL